VVQFKTTRPHDVLHPPKIHDICGTQPIACRETELRAVFRAVFLVFWKTFPELAEIIALAVWKSSVALGIICGVDIFTVIVI
jgi:hypothetical protein